jgi:thiamine biosynthesis lipoprotein
VLNNQSIATSGNYRKFIEQGGKRFSHFIDLRTARPTNHQAFSASVIHPSTAYADAYATAMMVLGVEKGLKLAEKQQLPVYFIESRDSGTLLTRQSSKGKSIQTITLGQRTDTKGNKGFASTFGVTLVFFLCFVGAMATGIFLKRKPISGSCGGIANVMGESGCDACEEKNVCKRTGKALRSS